jgi:hypothetical protein
MNKVSGRDPTGQAGRATHRAVPSRPSGDHPSRKDLRALTKPQLRVLLETAKVPQGARRGYMVKGAQWPPILRLRHLGLIYVDHYSGHFCRDTMWLMPTDKGRAWAAHAQAIEAQRAGTTEIGPVEDESAGLKDGANNA